MMLSFPAGIVTHPHKMLHTVLQAPRHLTTCTMAGRRCDRENRHRGICNTRAAPAAFVQQALSSMEEHMDGAHLALALCSSALAACPLQMNVR